MARLTAFSCWLATFPGVANAISRDDAVPADADEGRHGGPTGNERLTASTGALLLVLLAVEGLTVLSLRSLLSLHIFIGVLLIPPVLLKIASTGFRFVRYYMGDGPYVRKGPPALLLRALGPVIVLSSVVLFATGVALLVTGPGGGAIRGIHKLSFIVLFAALGVHVLAYVRKLPALVTADWRRRTRLAGASARRGLLLVTLVAGLAFGGAAVAFDGPWVHRDRHHQLDDGGH
jgi:hypothetical protein